jgi:LemA protein
VSPGIQHESYNAAHEKPPQEDAMELTTIVLLAVLVVAIVYFVMLYNQLVQIKHNVSKAWANVDVLLKQRHDELPKLVETCKQYMQFEQETLTRVMQARSSVSDAREHRNVPALGAAEGELRGALGRLFAVAEDYPDLKANDTFRHLQGRISGLENAIADRREFYNESVNVNNVRIEQFPDSIVAALFSFRSFDLLRFSSEHTRDVDMKELFRA